MASLLRVVLGITHPAFAALILITAGCKPASKPSADRTPSLSDEGSGAHGSRQPSAGDFNEFFQTLLPSVVKFSDLKTDPPLRMPNTPPDSNTWLINVKITLTPVEDLLALPTPEDAHTIDNLANELNALIAWRNVYARSPYAAAYGAFDVQAPSAPVPQLLVVQQAKAKPLPPLYGKIAAEWQVDHWQFTNVDLELPQMGQPRSAFAGGPTMVKGSPEAEAFLTAQRKAINAAKQKQAAVEESYLNDLRAAVQPGSVYAGKISHRLGALPCELRFLDQPAGDTQTTLFEVRLTNEPSYQFIYSAKLVTPLPIGTSASSPNGESFRVPDESNSAPVGDLTVNFSRGSGGGKDEDGKTLPGMVLRGQKGHYTGHDQPFLLLGGHIQGVVSNYANDQFTLTAQKKP